MNAITAAVAAGCRTFQLFTKNTNQWRAAPLSDEGVEAFKRAFAESGFAEAVAHNSYLANLASPDDDLWKKSIDSVVVEVERCAALGIGDLVMHPGAAMGSDENTAVKRVAKGLDKILARTKGIGVFIDLENTAGQGSCLARSSKPWEASSST